MLIENPRSAKSADLYCHAQRSERRVSTRTYFFTMLI